MQVPGIDPFRRVIAPVLFALVVCATLVPSAHADGGYLGIHLQDVDEALRAALDLESDADGAVITEVLVDSPAARAGLERGDVILLVGDTPVKSTKGLTRRVRRADPGDEVTLTVLRDGKRQNIKVTLGEQEITSGDRRVFRFRNGDDDVMFFGDEHSDGRGVAPRMNAFFLRGGPALGVRVEALDSDLGRYFGAETGLLVLEVYEESAAAEAGLQRGDIVVEVHGEPVEQASDIREILAELDEEETVEVVVLRDRDRVKFMVAIDDAMPDGLGQLGDRMQWFHREAPDAGYPRGHIDRMHGLHERHQRDRQDLDTDMEELKRQMEVLRKELEALRQGD